MKALTILAAVTLVIGLTACANQQSTVRTKQGAVAGAAVGAAVGGVIGHQKGRGLEGAYRWSHRRTGRHGPGKRRRRAHDRHSILMPIVQDRSPRMMYSGDRDRYVMFRGAADGRVCQCHVPLLRDDLCRRG